MWASTPLGDGPATILRDQYCHSSPKALAWVLRVPIGMSTGRVMNSRSGHVRNGIRPLDSNITASADQTALGDQVFAANNEPGTVGSSHNFAAEAEAEEVGLQILVGHL